MRKRIAVLLIGFFTLLTSAVSSAAGIEQCSLDSFDKNVPVLLLPYTDYNQFHTPIGFSQSTVRNHVVNQLTFKQRAGQRGTFQVLFAAKKPVLTTYFLPPSASSSSQSLETGTPCYADTDVSELALDAYVRLIERLIQESLAARVTNQISGGFAGLDLASTFSGPSGPTYIPTVRIEESW